MLNDHLKIISAHEIKEDFLIDYYNEIYPDRCKSLKKNWIWQNRSNYFSKNSPILIVDKLSSEVVAHLGMIPFKIVINKKTYDAQWLIDFSVHPRHQRKGLGIEITKKWMEYSDVHLTCCNEKAINIFKKLGWMQNKSSFYHLFLINPFYHKKLKLNNDGLNRTFNIILKSFLFKKYKNLSFPMGSLNIGKINIDKLKNMNFFSSDNKNLIYPLRDDGYLNWRFIDSYDSTSYKLFYSNFSKLKLIIKINNQNGRNYVSVLSQTSFNDFEELAKMLSSLFLWADSEGYDFVDFYTSDINISNKLLYKLFSPRSYQIFAYHSKNKELFNSLKTSKYRFDYCDSDFEKYFE